MNAYRRTDITDRLLRRVCSEFMEMPGLRITGKQAQRLWGLDEHTCLHILETLVEAKFLWRTGYGMYARLTDGQAYPRPLMARLGLDGPAVRNAKAGA
jgi:hypothetical protein